MSRHCAKTDCDCDCFDVIHRPASECPYKCGNEENHHDFTTGKPFEKKDEAPK